MNVHSRPGAGWWAIAVIVTLPGMTACTGPNPAFVQRRPADAAAPIDRPVADAPADPLAADLPDSSDLSDLASDLTAADLSSPDAQADLAGPDGAFEAPAPDVVDAPPPLVADCPAVPELALCLRFETTPARDESPNATAVTATNVRFDADVDGRAAFRTSTSTIQVAESAALASPAITIEAWVKPSVLPDNDDERAAIIDYSRQYALVVLDGGDVQCRVNTGGSSYIDLNAPGLLKIGTWSSIACTVADGAYSLWHNGVRVANRSISGPLVARNTTEPFLVGSNFPTSANPQTDPFLGHVDNVRIWRRLRTPQELCRGAFSCTP
jgi:hypothetical protein